MHVITYNTTKYKKKPFVLHTMADCWVEAKVNFSLIKKWTQTGIFLLKWYKHIQASVRP